MHFTLAELIDPPDADTSYVGSQQQIIWRDITLAGGAELTIAFRAKVDEDAASGRYDNVIQVQIDDLVLPPSQPMASVWVEELPRADGKVSKTDGRLIAQKGTQIDYTITYNNASAELAFESIVLTETISPITYVAVLGGDWTPVGDDRFRREIVEVLEPGESRTVQFSVELSPDTPDDYQWLHNQVELGYTTAGPAIESTPGDNAAEDVNRIIGSGDSVVIVKAASYAGDKLVAGQELTYTITLFNVLTQTQSVRITDTLPVSFTLSAALSPPAIELTQTVDGHQLVVWDGLTIPGENSISIIFRARVDPDAEQGAACNSVQVQLGDGQVLPATGPLACVDVQRLWKVDAYVNKANTDNKGWASPGDTVHYLIQYGNANTSQTALATIVLTETISPPAVIEAMLSDHWVSLGNGKYRRTLSGADLAPGGTGQLYFSIRLSDTIPANVTSVHNQVEIGFITAEPSVEVNPSNNVSTDVTAVQEAIHQVYLPLVIRK